MLDPICVIIGRVVKLWTRKIKRKCHISKLIKRQCVTPKEKVNTDSEHFDMLPISQPSLAAEVLNFKILSSPGLSALGCSLQKQTSWFGLRGGAVYHTGLTQCCSDFGTCAVRRSYERH